MENVKRYKIEGPLMVIPRDESVTVRMIAHSYGMDGECVIEMQDGSMPTGYEVSEGFAPVQDLLYYAFETWPESVTSRCTKSHEYIFMLTKSPRYYFDKQALREPANTGVRKNEYNHRKVKFVVQGHRQEQFRGCNQSDGFRNKRDVWSMLVRPCYKGHHATFPLEIPLQCIALGCPEGGTVLDPFMGSGTTAVAAIKEHRHFVGFELNGDYFDIAQQRIAEELRQPTLF